MGEVMFNPAYYNAEETYMRIVSPAIAETQEMKVSKIVITISQKITDYDTFGAKNDTIQIADLFIMGK